MCLLAAQSGCCMRLAPGWEPPVVVQRMYTQTSSFKFVKAQIVRSSSLKERNVVSMRTSSETAVKERRTAEKRG